ncbi:hypothetical protein GBK02_10000 [Dechloromonas sp. TW-R-39-2]|uniref:hypothetical protein n=1 Tax=Dechloromonas sp. TW-R-39-2 TaxID=2654218 RepID=UPI00193E7377|nr:hypothetical protein [Dechloromonas sp. TW-R-39-2]QRM19710.1 hypothetical protein GBK02_10000 [Dechloromonas sp. TW-R-39-2]
MAIKTNFKTASRICDVIGLPGTMAMCGFFGKAGQRVYIPTTAKPEHLLKKLVGEHDFNRLVDAFGGEYLEVPEVDLSALRRAGIIYRLSNRGVPVHDIAHLVGAAPRSVKAIRAELRLEGFTDLADTLQVEEITESEGGHHD